MEELSEDVVYEEFEYNDSFRDIPIYEQAILEESAEKFSSP